MRWVSRVLFASVVFATAASAALAAESRWLRYPAISPDGSTIVFGYRGDLWSVPSAGGVAVPLTLHEAYDSHPVWSRDGSTIAFASDRYGNFDVWTVPAAGGRATRLTFHSANDIPTSFHPVDGSVVFRSARMDAVTSVQFPTGAQPELYAVSTEGGMPRRLVTTPAIYAVHDRAGRRMAYSDRKGYETEWRKHDDSSFARDVWMLDVASGEHTRLTDFGHDDRSPVWSPDEASLYFLSERGGNFNVWKLDVDDPKNVELVTRHRTHPVRFLSISNAGDLCYAYDGSIWVRRAGESRSRRLEVVAERDDRANDRQFLDVGRNIGEFAVSPDGKEIAFVARGEVFVTSTDHGDTRRITDTPEQERSVSFHPKGRGLLYASERNGSWNLYRTDIADDDELNFFNATSLVETPVLEIDDETFQPRFSPPGKEVAYLRERTRLEVLNLESGKRRTILPGDRNYSYIDGDQFYDWSPDGQHFLVNYLSPGRWSREIGLVPASGEGETVNVTRGGFEDIAPQWVQGGEGMIWYTDRWGSRATSLHGVEYDVRLAWFTEDAWERWRMSEIELEQHRELEKRREKKKKDDEAKEAKEAKGANDEKEKAEGEKEGDEDAIELPDPVELELDRLEDRTVRLTLHSSRLGSAAVTPDGERLLYLARFERGFDLWSYVPRKQEVKLLAKLNANSAGNLAIDSEGKRAYLLVDGGLRVVDLGSGAPKPVALRARMHLRPDDERAYLYEHVWRQTLKKFHDVDMHGADWKGLKTYYAQFLPFVETSRDFVELISELLGELNASHTGGRHAGGAPNGDATASLGFFPDESWEGDGIRIAELLPRSPLLRSESRIGNGTIVVSIDGTVIDAGENWYPLLNRKAGVPVRLGLRDDAGETWEEVVKPISTGAEGQLLYERWARTRREEVERLSGGRIGYSHIRGMNDNAFRDTFEDVFGDAVDKEAIVLDMRFNGGGNLDEALPIFLSGETYMRAKPRGQSIGSIPSRRWTRPSILIQNEGNYSDAHCVPNAYRSLGLGETVGMQVPGTCTSVWWEQLQNPEVIFGIPQVTWLDNDGRPLENNHFDPDHEVDNDPAREAAGRDEQLERAVEVLLERLDG